MEIAPPLVGALSFVMLLVLILVIKTPIFLAFMATGFFGYLYLAGFNAASSLLVSSVWETCRNYVMLAIPLFMIMGQFASIAGIGADLYTGASKWVGRLPGGLAIATVWGCAGFAACTGSSVTGILTFGPMAYKPMLDQGYDRRLTLGALCCGATIGIMIPPSLSFILYGVITEESVGKLFMAGIFPGLLEAALYTGAILLVIKLGIFRAPRGTSYSWKERIFSLRKVWGMILLMTLVLGGIYGGIFTATEAGAMGAIVAIIMWVSRKGLNWTKFRDSIADSIAMACMAYAIIAGGMYYAKFIGLSGLSRMLIDVLVYSGLSPLTTIVLFLMVYIILGCFVPPICVLLLTLPFLHPLFTEVYGLSGIWLGVICVMGVELASITPPVGMNLFVTQGFVGKGVPLREIYQGVIPFVIADVIRLVILVAFPIISVWLPGMVIKPRR